MMTPEQYVEMFAVNYDLSEELADDIGKALRQTRSEAFTEAHADHIYADYSAERIRADQLWDIAHALQAALSRLLDSQRGLNLQEWQAATAQGRAALAKANDAETES